ncbi:hypothetical protein [Candidatus Proelusimicrobium excrementi]|uniref:hypothetical protein n=1 Tax=Candidatus Proelusimicrobium excrementi TaxID=3416222 RepID=UPI003C8B11C4|nr:hypothetical protein [Elusimicrobiaceae bacterium]
MKINKEQLISVCLGLVNLINKNVDQDFLDTEPEEICLDYELKIGKVSFKLSGLDTEAKK